jgi:hypothetical protein
MDTVTVEKRVALRRSSVLCKIDVQEEVTKGIRELKRVAL